jgi:WD40 repeat protein
MWNNLSYCEKFKYFSYSSGSKVLLYQLNGNLINKIDAHCNVHSVRFIKLHGNDFLAIACENGFQLWTADGERMVFLSQLSELIDDTDRRRNLFMSGATSTEEEYLYIGSSLGHIFVFEVLNANCEGTKLKTVMKKTEHPITFLDAVGKVCIAGDENGGILICHSNSLDSELLHSFEGAGFPCTSIASRPSFFAASFSTGHLRFYSLKNYSLQFEITAHVRPISAIDISSDGEVVVSCGEDKVVQVWNCSDLEKGAMRPPTHLAEDSNSPGLLTGIALATNNKILASVFELTEISTLTF